MATKSQNLGMFIGLSAQWKPFVSVRILVSNTPFDEFRIAWRTKMSDMSLRTKGCVLDVSLGARPGLRTIIYSSATLHRCAIFASISWNFSRKAVASKRHGAWQIWNSSKFCKFSAIPNQWCIGKNIQVNIESVPNQNDKWELCCYWNSMQLPVLEHVSNSMSNVQPKFRHSCWERVCLLRATVLLETCTQYEHWGFSSRWFQPIWIY